MKNKISQAIVNLGLAFSQAASPSDSISENAQLLVQAAEDSFFKNPWFTRGNVLKCYSAWGVALTPEKIEEFTSRYHKNQGDHNTKTIGIISAGNIPFVGLHDILCCLFSGHRALIKLSGRDADLTSLIINILEQLEPSLKGMVTIAEDRLTQFDAIIATGSNNSSRYFEYYFAKYPHIIRKNRNGVALLNGNESKEELALLGNDIYQYFGLGCRNVAKIFVPKGYNLATLFEAIEPWNGIINHSKYANNYSYNRALWLIDLAPHLDTGFMLFRRDTSFVSPIATLFYEEYEELEQIIQFLNLNIEQLQCVVSNIEQVPIRVNFGQTQQPELWDFADGVDTMKFLETI
ncbi:hypothetical protein [Williamwhitmania taraxaci]|uniref:Acyl-CoA reductase (LuxC) n=1 Tax=Williamwhitmania taraxaci TaxID=1640674 RepID=A0A1G6GI07_9BACT|nr:hypothetical protein [Williamwhitmania taraxaci]SDB81641.1 hypothetical protein SAMN05216323_100199 [Williamwhitmania taraxaci]